MINIYDTTIFILFIIFIIIYLFKNKNNVKRDGLMVLYRTQFGVRFIDKFAKKHTKFLRTLQYAIIAVGYLLMIIMIVAAIFTVYTYFKIPSGSAIAKVPAVFPIFPYFSEFFGLSSFLPPFYFMYFLLVIAVIAIVHEGAHGILARFHKVRIKSTGFLFLGPLVGAFVEQDDRDMNKRKTLPQLSILAAGVFANVLTAILGMLILFAFFHLAFQPAGVNVLNTYPSIIVPTSLVVSSYPSIINSNSSLIKITLENTTFFADPQVITESAKGGYNYTWVYLDSSTLRQRIFGEPLRIGDQIGVKAAITEVNGVKVNNALELSKLVKSNTAKDTIRVKFVYSDSLILSQTKPFYSGQIKEYNLTLTDLNGTKYIGVLPATQDSTTGVKRLSSYLAFSPIRDLSIYYQSNLGEFGIFIYYLLWWTAFLNAMVAIFNMIPAGIFDGGRFFYLTMLSLTKKEKTAKTLSRISAWIFLLLLALILVKNFSNIFFH